MHPALATTKIGPFKSRYHMKAADDDFREALSDYLVSHLLPQVDEPFSDASGRLSATYNAPKYCGPNSAVRDIYTLEFEFRRSASTDFIKADLVFSPKSSSFCQRYRGLLGFYLWTASRQNLQARRTRRIEAVCRSILRGEVSVAKCPCCGMQLRITNTPGLFDVLCPERCFSYNFHRDRESGDFHHGHFFCRPPTDA